MTNTPNSFHPIAQSVAQYQSNGHQTIPPQQQPVSQPQQRKSWAGFAGRTLWDWLNLLGVLLVPLILGAGTFLIAAQQSVISQNQHESDQRIANNQFQEGLLKTFRDDINHLIFERQLLTAKSGDPVQIMAQSYTNDALRKLDLSRRALLVQFLSDLHLNTSPSEAPPLISLSGANLQGAYLQGVDLYKAHLSGADLSKADLSRATLSGGNLRGANLQGVDLQEANLYKANLSGADLRGTNLRGADLRGANLQGANATSEQLAEAKYLKDARLPDGSRYPSTSYSILDHHEPTN